MILELSCSVEIEVPAGQDDPEEVEYLTIDVRFKRKQWTETEIMGGFPKELTYHDDDDFLFTYGDKTEVGPNEFAEVFGRAVLKIVMEQASENGNE